MEAERELKAALVAEQTSALKIKQVSHYDVGLSMGWVGKCNIVSRSHLWVGYGVGG